MVCCIFGIHCQLPHAEAKEITTVEYRKVQSTISQHRMMLPLDWATDWVKGMLNQVDFAFSYSSWEHDGLGRYGDPLDPWGDIKAVERASCYVKPGATAWLWLSLVASWARTAQRILPGGRIGLVQACIDDAS
jgi:hypothetical protein